jgi:HSP20 family protein
LSALSSWEPAPDISNVRQMMDRFVNDPMFAGASWPHTALKSQDCGQNFAIDVIERECGFLVSAALPGVHPEDITIELIDNVLTIRGECRIEPPMDNESYHLRERLRGSFSRRIVFPATINAERVEASYEHGVLTLRMPKCGNFKPTRISVHTANGEFSSRTALPVRTQPAPRAPMHS